MSNLKLPLAVISTAMILSTHLFASDNNRATIADIREAAYILIEDGKIQKEQNGKTEAELKQLTKRQVELDDLQKDIRVNLFLKESAWDREINAFIKKPTNN